MTEINAAQPLSPSSLKRETLAALRGMRKRLEEMGDSRRMGIAIIGMACKFPGGVEDSESYWDLLCGEVDAVREIPRERFDIDEIWDSSPQTPGKTYSRWAGLLDRVDEFDGDFFGISPREAANMDPQQRIFLQCAWRALENAGIAPLSLSGSGTGVFVGATTHEYSSLQTRVVANRDLDRFSGLGMALNVIAGRVSYGLGLQGPSMCIDTACSSSLVAVDRACRSLRDAECELAIAGGVNILAFRDSLITASHWGMLSVSGRVRSFSRGADGFVRGEGCGVVVLKRVGAAQRSGDRILGVILGSAVNHDGASSGLTVPNGQAQAALLRSALRSAGVEPGGVGYVEAHGTGTRLGDPIEAEALGAVFAGERERRLGIGSVKTNIGHLEAAAGIAGLIKLVLSLGHGEIPAQLYGEPLSEHVRWNELPLEVVTERRRWEPIGGRRIGGVSSFGFSGTNAHVIVEAPPAAAKRTAGGWERGVEILPVSAKSAAALAELAGRYGAHVGSHPEQEWRDVCHTAGVGRTHFRQRLAVVAGTSAEGLGLLRSGERGEPAAGLLRSAAEGARPGRRIGFLFSGQGSQYVGMGRALYAGSAVYREVVNRCEAALGGGLEAGLVAVMHGEHPESARLLERTEYAQPALFALECGLAAVWRSWGVEPDVVLGHSLGEYAAAAAAGVMTVEEGSALVAARGRLMQGMAVGGAMLSLDQGEAAAREALRGWETEVSLAAVNGARQTVLAGRRGALEEIAARWEQGGGRMRWLAVDQAYHSPLTEPIAEVWEREASRLAYRRPRLRLLSNLTGEEVEQISGSYWRRHMREPVRFAECVDRGLELGVEVWVEAGPRPVLLGLARQRAAGGGKSWIASLRPEEGDWPTLARGLAEAYVAGVEVDWGGWNQERERIRVALPGYSFERQRHWLATPPPEARPEERGIALGGRGTGHPLLGERLRLAGEGTRYQQWLRPEGELAWLGEHRPGGQTLLPATAFFEMLLAAGDQLPGSGEPMLEEVALLAPLALEGGRVVQVVVDSPATPGERTRIQVYSAAAASQDQTPGPRDAKGNIDIPAQGDDPEWRLHVEGYVRRTPAGTLSSPQLPSETIQMRLEALLETVPGRGSERLEADAFYTRMRARGADLGPRFQGVQRLWRRPGEALAEVRLETLGKRIHPAALDACLQVASTLLPQDSNPCLPFRLGRMLLHPSPAPDAPLTCWVHATLLPSPPQSPQVELSLYLQPLTLNPFASLQKLLFATPHARTLTRSSNWIFTSEWAPRSPRVERKPANYFGTWMILADRLGFGAKLADQISAAGGSCFMIESGEKFHQINEKRFAVAGGNRDHFARVLQEVQSSLAKLRIVHLWSLDAPHFQEIGADMLIESQRLGYGTCLALLQAMLERKMDAALFLVTRSVEAKYLGMDSLPRAGLWALRRTLQTEHPEIWTKSIHLAGEWDTQEHDWLMRELQEDGEPEVAISAAGPFVPRWTPQNTPSRDDQLSVELKPGATGVIEDLRYALAPRREPSEVEVEIEVYATGLNFRDLLNVLNMLPDLDSRIGGECAGVVVRAGVHAGFAPGDEVLAFAPGSFRSFATVPARNVARKPADLSFEQAAALPVAYLTALLGLDRLACIQRDDSILIHAAAGGLGQAALRLAKARGARIYATAGSEAKREYLFAQGVELAMNSRTLEFADQVMEATAGCGVNIVLNSLAGKFIDESLRVLASGGCFLETGKRGVLTPEEVASRRSDAKYFLFDLGVEADKDRTLIPSLMKQMMNELNHGILSPLPVEPTPFREAAHAFRKFAGATRIGKLVVTHDRSWHPQRGTYLITGGLGALGLSALQWLFRRGARSFLLVSRQKHPSSDGVLLELKAAGAEIRVVHADCARYDSLAAAIKAIPETVPLRGVIHCAGLLQDGAIPEQTWKSFYEVAAPKILGAWNLHQTTHGLPLNFFITFSSAAAVVGSPGQANYAAANAAMDSLAHFRHAQGLPSLSVNWGPWTAGMAVQYGKAGIQRNLGAIDIHPGFEILEHLLQCEAVQAAVIPFHERDAPRIAQTLAENGMRFSALRPPSKTSGIQQTSLISRFTEEPAGSRSRLLIDYIASTLTDVAGLTPATRITPETSFFDLGFDSLMAVELRNALMKSLGRTLPATLALDYPTVGGLADYLSSCIATEIVVTPEVRNGSVHPEIFALTEAEAERLLLSEIEGRGNAS